MSADDGDSGDTQSTGGAGSVPATKRKHLSHYTGDERYIGWIEDYLGIRLSDAQKEVARAIVKHRKVLVVGANGFGKTWIDAAISLGFLFRNFPATVLATAGNFPKMKRTYCDDVQTLHEYAVQFGVPGDYKEGDQKIKIDGHPELGFEAAKPQDSDELEGAHNTYLLAVIEEADKDGVDADVVESMESLLSDRRDRILATANPPRDENNVVYDMMRDDTWKVLQFSSFESHNVLIDRDIIDSEPITGLVTTDEIRESWIGWNDEPWPGLDAAMASGERDDLAQAWYRRRLGVMPPDNARVRRPYTVSDTRAAYKRLPETITEVPHGLALDVGGSGTSSDSNVLTGVFGDDLRVINEWSGLTHPENETMVQSLVNPEWRAPLMIDAVGEGSGLADYVERFYPQTVHFNSGAVPEKSKEYESCWSQGLAELGKYLRRGGSISDTSLRDELYSGARNVEFTEKYLKSRGTTVIRATSKDVIKKDLGHSPDYLDSALMAAYAARTDQTEESGGDWGW